MPEDPVTDPPPRPVDIATAGHRGDEATARQGLLSSDPVAREVALGALARLGALDEPTISGAMADESPAVRRRACDVIATFEHPGALLAALLSALDDDDVLVVEAACWALGEQRATEAVDALGRTARHHDDTRAREAAVAALGAIGDPAGLRAVLDALDDKPTVRRRAVVALAAFEGEEVTAAIERSAADRDWQVREVAEILRDQ